MQVIGSIVGLAGKVPGGYSKIGDDVATIPLGRKHLVLKVDMLVEGTDVPPGMTYRQAARKSVAMCVSDFAAKGVRPDSFMISLGLRRGVTDDEVRELGQGFRDAEREWGVRLVGGDTNEAKELVIDCAMVGFGKRLVARRGASPGELLVVTGSFGLEPSGLKVLLRNAKADRDFAARAKGSVLRPTPSLDVGLSLAPFLTSGMDSSDGLARSIHTLARESGVGFEVTNLPEAEGVRRFARENGLEFEKLVLEGGEEYVIVGTLRASRMQAASRAVQRAGGKLIMIGRATSEKRVVVLQSGGRPKLIRNAGWTHLG